MTVGGPERKPDRRVGDDRLERIENRLDDIVTQLSSMKVQDEKILHLEGRVNTLEGRVNTLWGCWDRLVGQEGTLSRMRDHQASCPRGQIKWLWIVVVPMGLTQLGMALTLFQLASRLAQVAQTVPQ